jgi:hypothetical protein
MQSIVIRELTADDIGKKIKIKREEINHGKDKKKKKTVTVIKKAVLVSWNTIFIFAIPYTATPPAKESIYDYHPVPFNPKECTFNNESEKEE